MSRQNILAIRLPSDAQTRFTTSLQSAFQAQITTLSQHCPGNWFLTHVHSYNTQRDGAAHTTTGEHNPDICFYYDAPPPRRNRHHNRPAATHAKPPTIIIEICSADKASDMGALAGHYLRAGNGATRIVVALDVERGTYSVWRWLRYLPTRVDGHEYRRCYQTENGVRWRAEDGAAAAEVEGELALTVRDFMPTVLPRFDFGPGGEEGMEALMRAQVVVSFGRLCRMWARAVDGEEEEDEDEDEDGGSAPMDVSSLDGEGEDGEEEEGEDEDMDSFWESSDEEAEAEEVVRKGEGGGDE